VYVWTELDDLSAELIRNFRSLHGAHRFYLDLSTLPSLLKALENVNSMLHAILIIRKIIALLELKADISLLTQRDVLFNGREFVLY